MPYKDPKKQKLAQQEHYQNNKQDYISRMQQRRYAVKEWLWEYKKTLKCEQCDENHPAVLDFHHTDPTKKDLNPSTLSHTYMNKQRVIEEIQKCVVLCANCHRKTHFNLVDPKPSWKTLDNWEPTK